MIIESFFVGGIAHSSHLLGGSRNCAIADPQRDVQAYLDAAEALGMQITHVLVTHLHADFCSGHIELAKRTGAKIVMPVAGNCAFEHVGVAEGDTIELDDVLVRVVETPGHTPEHVSYLAVDRARGPEPVSVFSGDALFVGDVGRPDLFPGMARELAAKLHSSLHGKLLRLPDFCEVYPAHGAGSLCGRSMGAKRSSTIGYERLYNAALQLGHLEQFIDSLTTAMPPSPDHFGRLSDLNRRGPTFVGDLPVIEHLSPRRFAEEMKRHGTLVLDVREYAAFGGMHIPGAYHIDPAGNFGTFAGWILPPDQRILLVADDPADVPDAATGLRRVGLDGAVGYLKGGMSEWANAALPMDTVPQLSAQQLHEMVSGEREMTLLDVRTESEYSGYHIEGAIHTHAPDLRTEHAMLRKDLPTALICGSGRRSTMAAGILKRAGFSQVLNVAGGMTGYTSAGYAPECPVCVLPHGPRFLGGEAAAGEPAA